LFLVISICAILAVEFILNLTPPISRDALIHHLAIPKLWLKHGGIYEIKWAGFSYYPMNVDLLYLIPLYLNMDFLAKFIHMSFGLGTALLIYLYLKKRFGNLAGALGVLIFLSTPIIVRLSTQAYVDLGLIFFTTGSILAVLRYREGGFQEWKWLMIAAALMGLALGTKYNALIAWFFLTAAIIFTYARKTKNQLQALQTGFVFFALSLLLFSPWLIKNWIWTGNPFFPLFKGFFSFGHSPAQEGMYSVVSGSVSRGIFQTREMLYGESFWQSLLIPLRYFFQGQDNSRQYFDGVLNPMLIVLPLFAFMKKDFQHDKIFFAVFAVFFLLTATFLDQTRIRYILPVVPVLVLLSVTGLMNIYEWAASRPPVLKNLIYFLSAAVFTALLTLNGLYVKNYYLSIRPMNYVLGRESKDDFISRHHIGYPAVKFINAHTPKDAKIRLILFAGRGYYLDRLYEEGPDYGMSDIRGLVEHCRDDVTFKKYLQSWNCTHLLIRTALFEKFLGDNYTDETRQGLYRCMRNALRMIYNQDGCAVYEIAIKKITG
jgi:hypothetical protein